MIMESYLRLEALENNSKNKTRNSKLRLNPILCVIFEGVYDNNSPLSALRGTPHITRMIWKLITSYWQSLIEFQANQIVASNAKKIDRRFEEFPFMEL